jgi:hypothetical protein
MFASGSFAAASQKRATPVPNVTTSDTEKIFKLSNDQAEHVNRLLDISEISTIMRDSSETGLGKTFVFFSIANQLDLPLFVICPASLVEPTETKLRMYTNTPKLKRIISYSSLTNSDMLRGEKGDYAPTKRFKQLVEKGILLVCDEYHFAKNVDVMRSEAVQALIGEVVQQAEQARRKGDKFKSRVLVCSATQMDKNEQALGFLYNMCYVSGRLIQRRGNSINTSQYMKFLRICGSLAKSEQQFNIVTSIEETLQVKLFDEDYGPLEPEENEIKQSDAIMYQLTSNVIFPLITSEMKPFIPRLTFNAFFDFSRRQDDDLFQTGLKLLLQRSDETLAAITKGVLYTQMACVYQAVEFLCAFLKKYKNSKVCLAASYVEGVLDVARDRFGSKGYAVLALTSSNAKTAAQKAERVKLFQEDNNWRVMLMTSSLGVGIDLHDLAPSGRPRISMVLRDFSPISTHQMAGRFFRRNMYTFGPCYVFNSLKYGAAYNHITETVDKKSAVLKRVTKDIFSPEMTRSFPGMYPRCIVGGTIVDNQNQSQNILYIDEFLLMDQNKGKRLPDAELINRYINNEELAFVDKPLWFRKEESTPERDGYPAKLVPVDETFEGLKGIYWLNNFIEKGLTTNYTPKVGQSARNRYEKEIIPELTAIFDEIRKDKGTVKQDVSNNSFDDEIISSEDSD